MSRVYEGIKNRLGLINPGKQGIELQWFESYLSERQQYCSVNNHHSQLASVKASIPQGSSLGPLLFLIYINDLLCALRKSEPDIYAVDTGVFVSGGDMKILEENVNLDLQHVCSWLHAINSAQTHLDANI